MYNFIVSNENISLTETANITELKSDTLSNKNIKKKIIKKKIIKKKLNSQKEIVTSTIDSSQNIISNVNIDDPEVDNFKKTLAFQSINANTVNKIKPVLKREWLLAITN